MERLTMNIYDGVPILKKMLNMKGFCENMLGKGTSWINDKVNRRPYYFVTLGFTEQNVELINQAMQDVADFCRAHILKLPSEEDNKDVYAKYAIQRLKELRGIISMSYLRENYTNIANRTFTHKMNMAIGMNGKPRYFTEKDIIEINTGIIKMADTFSRLRFTL